VQQLAGNNDITNNKDITNKMFNQIIMKLLLTTDKMEIQIQKVRKFSTAQKKMTYLTTSLRVTSVTRHVVLIMCACDE